MKKDERRPSIRSEALEANLRETRADVEIPAEFRPLLEAARPHRGRHDELKRLLEEYFHPFRDDEFVVENMALQVLGRWFRYRFKPERGLLFSLFARLLCDLAQEGEQHAERLLAQVAPPRVQGEVAQQAREQG